MLLNKNGKKKSLFFILLAMLMLSAGPALWAEGENLLSNGDFSEGIGGWSLSTKDGGSGFTYHQSYHQYAVAEVWNGGTESWSVQFFQEGIPLQKGLTYRLSFKAKADSPRTVTVATGTSAAPRTAYAPEKTFSLTAEWAEFQFDFTMGSNTDPNGRVEFNLGLDTADVLLDDIRLVETGSLPTVRYEAENGILAGGAVYWATDVCSNGAKAAGLGYGGSSTITIDAPVGGTFETVIGYLSEGSLELEVTVNGSRQNTFAFAPSGGWFIGSVKTVPLTLTAGLNTLSIGNSNQVSAPDIDYIDIKFGKEIPAVPVYSYEAEDGTITGTARAEANQRCSGGFKVTGINDTGAVTINVDVPEEGFYSAFFKYNSSNDMDFLVEVNGRDIHYVWTNNVASWGRPETTFTPLYLNQGTNSIKVFNNRPETMELDQLKLFGSSPTVYESFDFEQGVDGWTTDNSGATTYTLETDLGMNDSACISIENPAAYPGKNYWKRVVSLEPGNYMVRAMVKGENITPQPGGTTGANINIEHTWDRNGDNGLIGTFDWREVYFPMNVKEGGSVNLVFQLGFYFSYCSGKVYFDDIIIMNDFSKIRIEGEETYVNVDIEDAQKVSRDSLVRWVDHLDALCLYMKDLVGGEAFDGRKTGVDYSYRYPGGWAVAGEPIIWFKPFMTSEISKIETMDDWIEGITHEFGHCTHYGGKEGSWDWNDEIWANFKKALALIDLNGRVHAFNRMFVGPEIKDLYKSYHGGGGYDNSFAKGIYNGDGLVYVLLDLREQIGLEPFKLTFRDLYANGVTGATTRLEKFQAIVDLLNYYSGNQPGYIENLLGADWDVIVTSELYSPGESR